MARFSGFTGLFDTIPPQPGTLRRAGDGTLVIYELDETRSTHPWMTIYWPASVGETDCRTYAWRHEDVASWALLYPDRPTIGRVKELQGAVKAHQREYGRMSALVGQLRAECARLRERLREMNTEEIARINRLLHEAGIDYPTGARGVEDLIGLAHLEPLTWHRGPGCFTPLDDRDPDKLWCDFCGDGVVLEHRGRYVCVQCGRTGGDYD